MSDQRYPTWRQAFVVLGGGLALLFSATFGYALLDYSNLYMTLRRLERLLVVLILGGVATSAFGVLLVMLRLMREAFSLLTKKDEGAS